MCGGMRGGMRFCGEMESYASSYRVCVDEISEPQYLSFDHLFLRGGLVYTWRDDDFRVGKLIAGFSRHAFGISPVWL